MVLRLINSLASLLLLAGACAAPPTSTPGDSGQVSSDCHQPPWYPAQPPAGVQATTCSGQRMFRFVLGTGEPLSNDDESVFLNAHRAELHAIDGIVGSGLGLCCLDSKASDPHCVALTLRLCSTPLPELVEKLREIQAGDENVAGRALRVSVALEGLTGPRCERAASDCGPLAYGPDAGVASPPESRTLVLESSFDSQTCDYDGECIKNGCGNECDHWTFGGMAGTCPLLTELQGAFCGCVANRCAWFR